MPLDITGIQPNLVIRAAHLTQFYNLLVGNMTDQPVSFKNRLTVGGGSTIAAGVVPLTVVGQVGQTADLFDVVSSSNSVIFGVPPSGVIFFAGASISGNLTVTGSAHVGSIVSTGGANLSSLVVPGATQLASPVGIGQAPVAGRAVSVTGGGYFDTINVSTSATINNLTVTGTSTGLPAGPQGPAGPTGPQGPAGVAGPVGPTGATGPAGSTGPAGPAGPQGAQGPIGNTGPAGPTGPQGPVGPVGINWRGAWSNTTAYAIGDAVNDGGSSWIATAANTGSEPPSASWAYLAEEGATGATGATGPAGPTGATGAQGPTGATGAQGPIGNTGPAGPTGATGAQGPAGTGVPAGGTTGQVLAKNSNTNYDSGWQTPAAGITIPLSQNLTFTPDNTYSIGTSGALRPNNVYVSNSVVVGTTSDPDSYGFATYTFSVITNPTSLPYANDYWLKLSDTSGASYTNLALVPAGTNHSTSFGLFDSADVSNASAFALVKNVAGGWDALETSANGTGTVKGIAFWSGTSNYQFWTSSGTVIWQIQAGNLLAGTDNTYDIGASGANRPRDLWLGRNLAVGGTSNLTGLAAIGGNAGPSTSYTLQVSSNTATVGATQTGVASSSIFSASATSAGRVFSATLGTAAVAFTMAAGYGLIVNPPNLGTNSVVTSAYGAYLSNQGSAQVTNAYGVYITNQTGATSTNIGLYNGGTTQFQNLIGQNIAPTNTYVAAWFNWTYGATANTTQYGMYVTPTFSTSATAAGVCLAVTFQTTSTTFSMTAGYGLQVQAPIKQAGLTLGTLYGAYVYNQGAAGITTAYGVYIAAQSGSTTNVGLYNGGTSQLTGAVTAAAGVNVTGGAFVGNGSVPAGGAASQVLTKNSATDYDLVWTTPSAGVSWPLLAPAGTAAAPSYAFSGAPGTGIYNWSGDFAVVVLGVLGIDVYTSGAHTFLGLSGAYANSNRAAAIGGLAPQRSLEVSTQLSGVTGSADALLANSLFTSGVTGTATMVRTQLNTQAATFTLATGAGFYAQAPALGAGNTVTNLYGAYFENQGSSSVTNAYGVYIAAQSGAATTNIGLYNAGTTQLQGTLTANGGITMPNTAPDSHLARVGIGTSQNNTDPGFDLRVNGGAFVGSLSIGGGNVSTTGSISAGGPLSGQYLIVGSNIGVTTNSSSQNLYLGTNNVGQWIVTTSGMLLANVDNAYDIGQATGGYRPRNLYLSGSVNIGSANERIHNGSANAASLLLESTDGWSLLSGGSGSNLAANTSFDGSSTWNRYNVAQPAMLLQVGAGSIGFLSAPAAANPISWTTVASLSSAGLLGLSGGLNVTSGFSAVTLPAGSANNYLGQYFSASVYTLAAANTWYETPISVTGTTTGGKVRIDWIVTLVSSVTGSINYTALYIDGTLQWSAGLWQCPTANYQGVVSGSFIVSVAAGGHRFSLGLQTNSMTLSTSGSAYSQLTAIEMRC